MTQFEAQLQRIREKLPLAKQKDSKLEVFGAKSHGYELAAPLSEENVRNFEINHHLQLPEDYRAFITGIGHGSSRSRYGGAGPYYGLYALTDFAMNNTDIDAIQPCQLRPNLAREAWAKHSEFLGQEGLSDNDYERYKYALFQGLLYIGTQGCSYFTCLVMNGPFKGRVVYIDEELSNPPFFCYEQNFLDWYERWLDELIAGYDLDWFGTKMAGDDAALIKTFQQSSDLETQSLALWSLFKLPTLQDETVRFLQQQTTQPQQDLRFTAFRLLTKYAYPIAKPFIKTFLNSDNPAEQSVAVKSIFWYAKAHSSEWVADIASFLPTVNDADTFNFIGYVLGESKQDYGAMLVPFFRHSEKTIRKNAVYLVGLLDNKARFLEDFMLSLEDTDSHVQVTTVQALNNVAEPRLLPYYERILETYPSNEHFILNHVLHRLKEIGQPAKRLLEKTLGHPNEEARAQAQKILVELKPTSNLLGWFKKSQ
jgi:HEAT repeat protein